MRAVRSGTSAKSTTPRPPGLQGFHRDVQLHDMRRFRIFSRLVEVHLQAGPIAALVAALGQPLAHHGLPDLGVLMRQDLEVADRVRAAGDSARAYLAVGRRADRDGDGHVHSQPVFVGDSGIVLVDAHDLGVGPYQAPWARPGEQLPEQPPKEGTVARVRAHVTQIGHVHLGDALHLDSCFAAFHRQPPRPVSSDRVEDTHCWSGRLPRLAHLLVLVAMALTILAVGRASGADPFARAHGERLSEHPGEGRRAGEAALQGHLGDGSGRVGE